MTLRFQDRVAIVTGAGAGLGRAYALALARRGACVAVNDRDAQAAIAVTEEIIASGGKAIACAGSVSDEAAVTRMVAQARDTWGRIDILIHNAGLLRDKSFAKMAIDEVKHVLDVHLMGGVLCCKAVWPAMVEQRYGRILLTTSAAGLFGNFGQTNYAAAKMGLVGLMQSLGIEGQKYGIHVNALAPTAATQMTKGVIDAETLSRFKPELVVPAMLVLTHEGASTRTILGAGAGTFEAMHIAMTEGIHLPESPDMAEQLAARIAEVTGKSKLQFPDNAFAQSAHELAKAK